MQVLNEKERLDLLNKITNGMARTNFYKDRESKTVKDTNNTIVEVSNNNNNQTLNKPNTEIEKKNNVEKNKKFYKNMMFVYIAAATVISTSYIAIFFSNPELFNTQPLNIAVGIIGVCLLSLAIICAVDSKIKINSISRSIDFQNSKNII